MSLGLFVVPLLLFTFTNIFKINIFYVQKHWLVSHTWKQNPIFMDLLGILVWIWIMLVVKRLKTTKRSPESTERT